MDSIGVFREKEINGKSFLIYTLSSQTSSSSSEAAAAIGGEGLPLLEPLFICPSLRIKVQELNQDDNDFGEEESFVPFNTSPQFPNITSSNQQVQYLIDSDNHDDICKLPVVPLFWCNNKEANYKELECHVCYSSKLGTDFYFCKMCQKKFHKECVESPLEIKHPSHPSYPFLSYQLHSISFGRVNCICCDIGIENIMYYCPTYKFTMHPVCAMKPIPFVIDYPKSHSHPLTFFPRQAFLPCNVCGLVKEVIPTYLCLRCVFVVHQDCIYFARVIKISRHHHRISFTSSLPSGKWFCGVCRREVDNHYGAYSCNKCSNYFVHTRCALRRDVWDGIDLEGVPEEPEIDVKPFEIIADGIILHFSHGHHLKLEISGIYDENKFCQACVLPIYEGSYYSCLDQCDFLLHEICANAPLKKHHALHPHPLMLKVVTNEYNNDGMFLCYACFGFNCGFVYESPIIDVHTSKGDLCFRLDLRCASVSEPFEYQGHEHPLFLALEPKEERIARCQICQEVGDDYPNYCRKLNCIECDYIICFKCATLPYKARYKHDKHFLTFSKEKEASDHSGWCEACETKIVYSRKGGFYVCDECCTTLHVHCLLGNDPYMKPGHTIKVKQNQLHILRNNSMSRPFCQDHDEDRCPFKVTFKLKNMNFCSYVCSDRYLDEITYTHSHG